MILWLFKCTELFQKSNRFSIEACHALTNSVPAKIKNDLFHSLGVFCFTTKAELVGEKQNKSWCCRVVSHEKPTTENWKSYFIGYTQLKDYAWSALEPGQKIDILSAPAIVGAEDLAALPPATSELTYPYIDETSASSSLFPPEPMASARAGHASDSTTMSNSGENSDRGNIPF